jgi:GT2 family glycosyltransferase
MAKPVAIILLNWNTPVHTINCIASLKQYAKGEVFDIIVADNGSTDGSLAVIKGQFPELIYIDNKENLGFAEGNNRGLSYSIEQGYTYSLVMNTDTEVDEDIVSKLTSHLELHPEVAAVQPAIYWMHDKTRLWNGMGCFNKVFGLFYSDKSFPRQSATFKIAEWLTGCCLMIRNSALAKSGMFNKQLFLYYEDVDLSFRLRGAGYKLHYLPACKMYHEAGASAKVNVNKREGTLSPIIHYYISRNRLWVLRKYGSPVYYPIYFLICTFYYGTLWIYFKLRGRNEKAALLIKGLKEGLFTPKNLIWP